MQSGVDDDVLNQWLEASSDEEEDEAETTTEQVTDKDFGRGGDRGEGEVGIDGSAGIPVDGARHTEAEIFYPAVSGGDLEARSAGEQEHIPYKPESLDTPTQVSTPLTTFGAESEKVDDVSRSWPAASAPTKSNSVIQSSEAAGSVLGVFGAEKRQMKRVMKPRLHDLLEHRVFLEGDRLFYLFPDGSQLACTITNHSASMDKRLKVHLESDDPMSPLSAGLRGHLPVLLRQGGMSFDLHPPPPQPADHILTSVSFFKLIAMWTHSGFASDFHFSSDLHAYEDKDLVVVKMGGVVMDHPIPLRALRDQFAEDGPWDFEKGRCGCNPSHASDSQLIRPQKPVLPSSLSTPPLTSSTSLAQSDSGSWRAHRPISSASTRSLLTAQRPRSEGQAGGEAVGGRDGGGARGMEGGGSRGRGMGIPAAQSISRGSVPLKQVGIEAGELKPKKRRKVVEEVEEVKVKEEEEDEEEEEGWGGVAEDERSDGWGSSGGQGGRADANEVGMGGAYSGVRGGEGHKSRFSPPHPPPLTDLETSTGQSEQEGEEGHQSTRGGGGASVFVRSLSIGRQEEGEAPDSKPLYTFDIDRFLSSIRSEEFLRKVQKTINLNPGPKEGRPRNELSKVFKRLLQPSQILEVLSAWLPQKVPKATRRRHVAELEKSDEKRESLKHTFVMIGYNLRRIAEESGFECVRLNLIRLVCVVCEDEKYVSGWAAEGVKLAIQLGQGRRCRAVRADWMLGETKKLMEVKILLRALQGKRPREKTNYRAGDELIKMVVGSY